MNIRIIIFFVLALIGIPAIFGMQIDCETAIKRYEVYTGNVGQSHKLLKTYVDEDGQPAAYVVTYNETGGFIILPADDSMKPMLGYSENESFNGDIPSPLKDMMVKYVNEVKNSRNKPRYIVREAQDERDEYEPINPLITTLWAQSTPYNDLVPNKLPTGCVATAIAQVMYYWKYPRTGYGSISYVYNGNTYSMELDEEDFDWDNMLLGYGKNYTEEQAHAVAYLMKACGYAVKMMYNKNGSGAYPADIPGAFIYNFGYDSTASRYQKSSYSSSQWVKLLYENLRDYGPMVFSGFTESHAGHTFVCDGYDRNGFFHFNWGWGANNGFFDIDEVNGFNVWDEVTANIRPKAAVVTSNSFTLNGVQYDGTQIISLADVSYLDLEFDFNVSTGIIDTLFFLTIEEEDPLQPEQSIEVFKTILPYHLSEGGQDITLHKQIILPDTDKDKQYRISLSYYGARDAEPVKAVEFAVK